MTLPAFEQMWAELAPVGRVGSGGYARHPWAPATAELEDWFGEAAAARGLTVQRDGFGNAVASTVAGTGAGPGRVLVGSHLDSVVEGGAYDGPLGVVGAFAALDLLRERGVELRRPIGI